MDEDLKALIESTAADTRRHFDIALEGIRHELGIVAETVVANKDQLQKVEAKLDPTVSHLDARVTRLEALTARGTK